jgi:hypothetical protein
MLITYNFIWDTGRVIRRSRGLGRPYVLVGGRANPLHHAGCVGNAVANYCADIAMNFTGFTHA